MEKNKKIYLVMPAYNEEANIENVIKQWYEILEYGNADSKIVVADAGSTDKTHDILMKLKEQYTKLEIVTNCRKEHGPKLICLYNYAIKNNADWIFQTDSDGQTNPLEFENFWNLRNQYDAIIGNRVNREDGKKRKLVEKVVCLLLKIYFGVNVPDANAPFRLMKMSLVCKYLNKLPKNYNIPNIMLTTYFSYNSENIIFKEITFKPRQLGKNSINISKIAKIGVKAISDFSKFKKEWSKNE